MSDELRQVANSFKLRVKSYTSYDVNGYRFHMSRHEQTRPGRKTTNSQVFAPDTNGVEYYGIIEEIYELEYEGRVPLTPVIFKCTAYSNTVAGRRTSGNSGFTRRTLNVTHIDQICNTKTCD